MDSVSTREQKFSAWYDRSYKWLFAIPLIIMIISIVYLFYFFSQTGDIILRDASLSGGTTITLQAQLDQQALETALQTQLDDVSVRRLTDLRTGEVISYIIESSDDVKDVQTAIESFLGYSLTSENSTIEFTGPTLSESFYQQLIIAMIVSFMLMSLVVFFLFRSFIPSMAVIFAALSDIVIPLAFINYLGITISAAGIAAFLMLIGYSVDTDILLTSRVLKRSEGSVNHRIFSAFKTGMFMTATALVAVIPAFIIFGGLP
ncbi:MAG: MMPL family transporter, partial [Nanoarchaeota archaeon]